MNFSHLTQGQPLEISASDWNAMIDMAKTYCQNKLSTTVPVADNQRFIVEGATTAYVQNASEVYDASFGTTLCIDGLANGQEVMKEKVRPTFKGVIPSTPKETGVPFDSWKWSHGKYCVCCEPIPMGAVGRAVIAGSDNK
jgi:hypothetical protein